MANDTVETILSAAILAESQAARESILLYLLKFCETDQTDTSLPHGLPRLQRGDRTKLVTRIGQLLETGNLSDAVRTGFLSLLGSTKKDTLNVTLPVLTRLLHRNLGEMSEASLTQLLVTLELLLHPFDKNIAAVLRDNQIAVNVANLLPGIPRGEDKRRQQAIDRVRMVLDRISRGDDFHR